MTAIAAVIGGEKSLDVRVYGGYTRLVITLNCEVIDLRGVTCYFTAGV